MGQSRIVGELRESCLPSSELWGWGGRALHQSKQGQGEDGVELHDDDGEQQWFLMRDLVGCEGPGAGSVWSIC